MKDRVKEIEAGVDLPVTIHCATCGGENVKADAYADWNEELQCWEIANIFDARFCDDCGHEVQAEERHKALERAKELNATTFLEVKPIEGSTAIVAKYSSDRGLRCHGQSLIGHQDGAHGLVIHADGTIPTEAEARDILMPHLAERAGEDPSPVSTGQRQADRMLDALVGMYDIEDVTDLIAHALCDLRHFADAHGLEFAERDKKGYYCYLAEQGQ